MQSSESVLNRVVNQMPPATSEDRPLSILQRFCDVAFTTAILIVTDCLIRMVPFGTIARRVQSELLWRASDAETQAAARRVRWAISAAVRRIPWTVPCLAQALAGNRLLARRGVPSELWLGVRPAQGRSLDAHAWLVADGQILTGAASEEEFEPLHSWITSAPRR